MHVHASHRRQGENRIVKNSSIGRHRNYIRIPRGESVEKFGNTDFDWLKKGNTLSLRNEFDRRGSQCLSAPFGTIGLSDDSHNLVIRLQ